MYLFNISSFLVFFILQNFRLKVYLFRNVIVFELTVI